MRITSKGQITIPPDIRARAGLLPQTEVEFASDGQAARIIPAKVHYNDRNGARVVTQLRGRGDVHLSTDVTLALTRDD